MKETGSLDVTGYVAEFTTGKPLAVLPAFANVAAAGTATSFIAAVAGYSIRVLAVAMIAGGTATDLTFNSATVAISPLFANAIRGVLVLPRNSDGWFQTVASEALTVTTGAGSTTGVLVTYVLVPA